MRDRLLLAVSVLLLVLVVVTIRSDADGAAGAAAYGAVWPRRALVPRHRPGTVTEEERAV